MCADIETAENNCAKPVHGVIGLQGGNAAGTGLHAGHVYWCCASPQQQTDNGSRVTSSLGHLMWSLAMVMLIHVICNGVDVKGTDYFGTWEALIQRVKHACRQG